jgi:hypothetical protein
MKKVAFALMLLLMLGGYGCSSEKLGRASGIGVVFDGAPLIFDTSVVYMGSTVGQILSSQWSNGVTRLSISLNSDGEDLKRSNMAAVVKNGQLNLVPLGGLGEALSSETCILGFENKIELQWFKLKHLIDNINMAADQQAQWLAARSGLAG